MRDILFIDDLLALYNAVVKNISIAAGQVYNIGGGPENTLSIWAEFGPLLEMVAGHPIQISYSNWRPGDQLVYISDIRKAQKDFGWRPQISVREGITRLYEWIRENQDLFSHLQI